MFSLSAPSASASAATRAPRLAKRDYLRCQNETPASVASLLGVKTADLIKWNRKAITDGSRPQFKKSVRSVVYYAAKPFARESVGRPNDGSLVGGMNLDCDGDDRGHGWIISAQRNNMYGTPETIENISRAARTYRAYFKDRGLKYVPLAVGDISAMRGGNLPPHASHQSGRDVDVGVVRTSDNKPGRFGQANAENVDLLRTWVMIKSFLDTKNVHYIFIHQTLKNEIEAYVRKIYRGQRGVFTKYVREFGASGVIRGDYEHSSHVHVRFKCPRGDKRCVP